jgi:hypothetical protein
MAAGRFQEFFGDDLEDAIDSLKSAPGAFGNIVIAAIRQLRFIDVAAFALVLVGWVFFAYGVVAGNSVWLLLVSLLPMALWFAAGIAGGVIFHVGGIGYRSLGYWESYVLILTFSWLGVLALRLALNPYDRRIHRGAPTDP